MFERLENDAAVLSFSFNGEPIQARAGDTVAAALLAAQCRMLRNTPVSGAPRGPFCMMGACYECLVEIGGETVQACQVRVTEGLSIRSPRTPGEIA